MITFVLIDEEDAGSGDVWAYEDVRDARDQFDVQVAKRKAEGWEVWSHVRHADKMIMENAEGARRTIEIIATTGGV